MPREMVEIGGRGTELKALAERVRTLAVAVATAMEYAETAPLVKGATLHSCRDAERLVEQALLALNMASDAAGKGVQAFSRAITEAAVARELAAEQEAREQAKQP